MNLEGKIIAFLGDSITEGAGVSNRKQNRYDNILKKECSLKAAYNYGIGGTKLAHQSVPSEKPRYDLCFCGRAYDIDHGADIIVVYGGVNDYLLGDAPIGKEGDKTPATFCGAVWFLMNLLKTRYPEAVTVFMTPARCCPGGATDTLPSPLPGKKSCAMPLIGYVEIIEKVAAKLGIPILNLYSELGIDPNDTLQREEYTVDGLHFNDKAHRIIAAKLKEFLEAL